MENTFNYKILDKIKLEKNADRIKFLNNNNLINENNFTYTLSACYELDKLTKLKTGILYLHKINFNYEEKFNEIQKLNLDYGVLDFKENLIKIEENKNMIFTANSDSSFSIFNIKFNNDNNNLNLKQIEKFKIPTNDKENTCNTLDISNINNNNTILLAMNDGYHHIFDLNSNSIIQSIKSHEYGIWSIISLEENLYLTGSEDSLLKMWDTRENSNNPIKINKSHTASVNCIYRDKLHNNDNIIITGSYDENFTVLDLRNFGKPIHRQKLNCAIWDINQIENRNNNKKENILSIASIYEGLNIFKYKENNSNSYELEVIKSFVIEENKNFHGSIVYGVDSYIYNKYGEDEKNLYYMATCSFYDNLILLWKIN